MSSSSDFPDIGQIAPGATLDIVPVPGNCGGSNPDMGPRHADRSPESWAKVIRLQTECWPVLDTSQLLKLTREIPA